MHGKTRPELSEVINSYHEAQAVANEAFERATDPAEALSLQIRAIGLGLQAGVLAVEKLQGGMSEFVRIGEAAEILKRSPDTLRRWEKTGRIQALRTPGGQRLYRRDSLKGLYDPDSPTSQDS